MNQHLIQYLILPKGVKSILFKLYVYAIPFLYSLGLERDHSRDFWQFLFILFLFEFVINPARYQFNDFIDYAGDQQRGHHWKRPVNEGNRWKVLLVASLRFVLGTSIAFFWDIRLGYLALTFLILQILYDLLVKKYSPMLSILIVSIAYPLRSLVAFYVLDIETNRTVYFLLLSIFLYATYMVLQWRRNESLVIIRDDLIKKAGTDFFSKPRINLIIIITMLLFIASFILSVNYLLNINNKFALLIYVASTILISILILWGKQLLKEVTNQFHNIFIVAIFIVLTLNKNWIALVVTLITILAMFWYHQVYIKQFSENYFNKSHYGKKE